MTPLKYYYAKKNGIELVIFNKYTIDTSGVIRNKKTEDTVCTRNNKSGYVITNVVGDDGKRRGITIGRAIASTFHGPPPTPDHTADHIDRDRDNDILDNIRWANKKEQCDNRDMPKNLEDALIIVKDDLEKTASEWIEYFKGQNNTFGREYTKRMITHYAQRKTHGFSYKKYSDLPDELWLEIVDSKTSRGYWKISNMNRVKYVTSHAENVLSIERISLNNGYPTIMINGKHQHCHILSFAAFFPDKWANKRPGEMILHEDDKSMDFRPHKLRIGTRSENGNDAHDNGRHNGYKKARVKCASYMGGIIEKEHDSQSDAVRYLKSIGFASASQSKIGLALNEDRKTAYKRTWKLIE
jgi:hypothetical protein